MINVILEKVKYIAAICNPSDENSEGELVNWFEADKFNKLINELDKNPNLSDVEIRNLYYSL